VDTWELTARECIRDTIAQYSHAGDAFRLNELAVAFCADGILAVRGQDEMVGREAIVRGLGGRPDADDETLRSERRAAGTDSGPRLLRHLVTNTRFVSVTTEEALVTSYFSAVTQVGLDHLGRYRDRLVPVDDRWLIARRDVSVDWRSDQSLYR
jgi:hypothetical protein